MSLRIKVNRPFWQLFFWCVLLIAIRNRSAVIRAEFWAEDGTQFFQDAIQYGLKSLVMPVYGYHFFYSRFVAYLSTLLPVIATPYLYALGALVANGLVCAYFVRPGFGWIVQSLEIRKLICLLLVVAPGAVEAYLSLCNVHNPLTLLGVFVVLEQPWEFTWKKLLFLSILSWSAGPMVLLIPIVIAIGVISQDKRWVFVSLVLLIPAISNAIGNHKSGEHHKMLNYEHLWLVPQIVLDNFLFRFFFGPFLGPEWVKKILLTKPYKFYLVSLFAFAALSFLLVRLGISAKKCGVMFLVLLMGATTFGIIAVSRSYNLGVVSRSNGEFLWNHRYSYLSGSLGIVVWGSILASWLGSAKTWKTKFVPIVFLLTITLHHFGRWSYDIYPRPNKHWPKVAQEVQEVLNLRAQNRLVENVSVAGIPMHPTEAGFDRFSLFVQASSKH